MSAFGLLVSALVDAAGVVVTRYERGQAVTGRHLSALALALEAVEREADRVEDEGEAAKPPSAPVELILRYHDTRLDALEAAAETGKPWEKPAIVAVTQAGRVSK